MTIIDIPIVIFILFQCCFTCQRRLSCFETDALITEVDDNLNSECSNHVHLSRSDQYMLVTSLPEKCWDIYDDRDICTIDVILLDEDHLPFLQHIPIINCV